MDPSVPRHLPCVIGIGGNGVPGARLVAVALGAAVVGVACSSPVDVGSEAAKAAEALIDDELSRRLDVEFERTRCDEVDDLTTGETFGCESSVAGQQVSFAAEMGEHETVDVAINEFILDDAAIDRVEEGTAAFIADEVGVELTAEDMDCGEAPVVTTAEKKIVCTLVDPSRGDRYDTMLTFDEGGEIIDVEVGSDPRRRPRSREPDRGPFTRSVGR